MRNWTSYVRERLRLHIPPEREAGVIREIAQQLEEKYDELIAAGLTPEEAAQKAEAQISDWSSLAREIDDAERPGPWSGMVNDLRYAGRVIRRNPMFAAVVIATLALAIGANTAMFTVGDAVAIRNLSYPEADRLVTLGAHRAKQPEVAEFTSAPDFFDLRRRSRTLSTIAGVSPVWNMITGDSQAERLECLFVSANFFRLLGARPTLGRLLVVDDDRPGKAAPVAILSDAYWKRRFGGSPDVLNRQIVLDGGQFKVIGVLPPGFRYAGEPLTSAPSDIQVYLPLAANPLIATPRTLRFMKVLAQLAPGVSPSEAQTELRRIGGDLAAQYPQSNQDFEWNLRTLREEAFGKYRSPVLILLGAVGFVLLLSSANIANLLLSRLSGRRQEISVRTALGASGYRILRQLLAESLALAMIGAVFGTALAGLLIRILKLTGPQALMNNPNIRLDTAALLFTAGVAVLACVLSGLLPAWCAATSEIAGALRTAGRSVTQKAHGLRSALVIGQVALAMLLLIGAGLLIHGFEKLLDVDPGFRADNLITISTQLPESVRTPEQRAAMYERIRSKLLAVPGVESVAAISRLPMMASDLTSSITPEGKLDDVELQFRRGTDNYFATMGIPLLRGRFFDPHDPSTASIAVLDETAAHLLWPGENAVGKRVRVGAQTRWTTIIGVTGATRQFGLDAIPRPTIYAPYAESPLGSPVLVIRTSGDPAPLLNGMTDAVRSVAKGLPAYNVFEMQTLVNRSTAQRRFLMMLLTSFAAAALLLAVLGLHGSVSQTVTHRAREIGLRVALGASPSSALRMVAGQGLRLAIAGLAFGAIAALGLTRLMTSVLFEIQPLDPVAFGGAAALLLIVALLACSAPALRAARLDPISALRED